MFLWNGTHFKGYVRICFLKDSGDVQGRDGTISHLLLKKVMREVNVLCAVSLTIGIGH